MKNSSKFLLTLLLVTILFSCSKNQKESAGDSKNQSHLSIENKNKLSKKEESRVPEKTGYNSFSIVSSDNVANANDTDQTANQFISSTAAVEAGKDSSRKFIRTADLKFKVKSVVNSTYAIEDIIREQKGFVASTNLTSTIDSKTTTAVSADSSVESTYFTVVNEMTVRVPNTKLDTTLKLIATLIDYLDYRNIKAEDVALQILSNKLALERASKSSQRLRYAIDNRGKKLSETTDAEELLSDREQQIDESKIANFSIEDQINFSTIKLSIYQRQALKRELISNDKNIDAFSPGFGKRVSDGLKSGWVFLLEIVIFVAQIWGLLLLALIGYFLYRTLRYRFKK
jgi:hypothetical protein